MFVLLGMHPLSSTSTPTHRNTTPFPVSQKHSDQAVQSLPPLTSHQQASQPCLRVSYASVGITNWRHAGQSWRTKVRFRCWPHFSKHPEPCNSRRRKRCPHVSIGCSLSLRWLAEHWLRVMKRGMGGCSCGDMSSSSWWKIHSTTNEITLVRLLNWKVLINDRTYDDARKNCKDRDYTSSN